MKEKFCEWYRIVCVEPTHEQLQNRWDSLLEYCESDDINVLELVRLFFGLRTDEQFRDQFIEQYASKDLTFQSKNEREVSLLAGATLMELLEEEFEVNKILLAIECIALFKQDVILPEVLEIVSDKLDDVTYGIRNELNKEQDYKSVSNEGMLELAKALEPGTWSSDSTIKFSKILSQIGTNFAIIQHNQEKLHKSLHIYKENSDVLSWLFGEWSNDLNKQLSKKVNQSQLALVLGKELADLVEQIPGPYSARAFLVRMLGHCKADKNNIPLVEMVDSLDENWKKQLLDNYNIIEDGENTPVLLAISKALEAGEPTVWKHAYQKTIGINAEEMISDPLTWAYQMYLECLLIKSYISED
jgi:hypothetical protein